MSKILYGAYTLLGSGLFMACLLPFFLYTRLSGRYGKNFKERLGYVPKDLSQRLSGSPRIWLHAVSLGEVRVAAPIIKALKRILPSCSIIVSTTTEHGRAFARQTLGRDIPIVYGPVDFIGSVRKALSRARPDVLVFLETEIWPAWLVEAHHMGVRTALINGRLSVRSIGGYLRFRSFFREILRHVDAFSMILEADAHRIMALGGDPEKVQVNGNAKYDSLADLTDPSEKTRMKEALGLGATQQVMVAGSTREGEEEMVLDAFEKIRRAFPEALLIIAPRHVGRTSAIVSLVTKRGLGCHLWKEIRQGVERTGPVVIINAFGELFKVFSVASVVYCGASLVPMGGQNPLEGAAWGKVVFYGPSMEDFLDAKAMLEEVGAGIPVSSPDMLAEKTIWFLRHPEVLKTRGERAREVVMEQHAAAEKHAWVISRLAAVRNTW